MSFFEQVLSIRRCVRILQFFEIMNAFRKCGAGIFVHPCVTLSKLHLAIAIISRPFPLLWIAVSYPLSRMFSPISPIGFCLLPVRETKTVNKYERMGLFWSLVFLRVSGGITAGKGGYFVILTICGRVCAWVREPAVFVWLSPFHLISYSVWPAREQGKPRDSRNARESEELCNLVKERAGAGWGYFVLLYWRRHATFIIYSHPEYGRALDHSHFRSVDEVEYGLCGKPLCPDLVPNLWMVRGWMLLLTLRI